MKRFFSVMLILVLVLSLVACTSNGNDKTNGADSSKEIIIGGLAPLTGEVSQYGIASNNGTMLAVKEINKAGGILGKQIKYVYYDEKGEPTEALNAYNRLVQNDKIVALVGDVTTKPSITVAQKAAQDGIPMITPTGTGEAITQAGDNIFRACFTDPYQGELMANYAFEKRGVKTTAILYDTGDDYSQGVADAYEKAALELGMQVTDKEGYQSGTSDFNAQLTKIAVGKPDAIMVPCYYEDATNIVVQARALGIDAIILGSDGWDGVLNQIDKNNAGALNNCYYSNQYALGKPNEKLQTFIDAYVEEYGEKENINMFAVLGYEAMHLLAAAIEQAGSVEPDLVVAAMKNMEFDGISGAISFKGGNDPFREAIIIEFVDGEEKVDGAYSFK